MNRVLVTALTSLIVAGMLCSQFAPTDVPVASACTGGSSLEFAAERARVIIVGDAIEVGDEINRAPTVTPRPTSTPAPTATPTPIFGSHGIAPTPVSPPVADPPTFAPYTPEGFSLAGYGVTLRTVRTIVGDEVDAPATVKIDQGTRAGIERELRELEGPGRHGISSCPVAAFTFKYSPGARYLAFAGDPQQPEFGLFTWFRMRVDGGDVLLGDSRLPELDKSFLYMTAEQYHRFFEGVDAEVSDENDFARITAPRVPLSAVIGLIADIRGDDVRITPPDTGSAGLLPHVTR